MLANRAQLAVEIEDVEGTAETLEGADVILAFNPRFEPIIEPHERSPVRSVFSPSPSVMGKRSARLSFEVELVGPGATGTALYFADALRACGVNQVLAATTTYKPVTAAASAPSATLALYKDGKAKKIWGARGTFRLLAEVGKAVRLAFDFTGADFSETDTALLSSGVSYHATIPPAFQGATYTLDSYAGTIGRMEIDAGNQVALRPDVNAGSGHKSALITGRKPMLTIDPEEVLAATEDYLGNWRAGTQMALSAAFGTGTGQVITITAPKVQFQNVSEAERDGNAAFDVNALLCLNSGDDEWQIAIT